MSPKTFSDWYEENRDSHNESRRNRYRDDPEYREKVLARNREARRKRRDEKLDLNRVRGARVFRVRATEEGEALFSIGALAAAVGRTVQTVRKWEKSGEIASTPHMGSKRQRLYTEAQIRDIRESLLERGRISGKPGEHPAYRMTQLHVRFSNRETREVQLFSVGMLAEVLERSRASILLLEKKGRLPLTPLRLHGQRFYSHEMLLGAREAYSQVGPVIRGEEAWQRFHALVEKAWAAYGAVQVMTQRDSLLAEELGDVEVDGE
jgi:hypothetical protein